MVAMVAAKEGLVRIILFCGRRAVVLFCLGEGSLLRPALILGFEDPLRLLGAEPANQLHALMSATQQLKVQAGVPGPRGPRPRLLGPLGAEHASQLHALTPTTQQLRCRQPSPDLKDDAHTPAAGEKDLGGDKGEEGKGVSRGEEGKGKDKGPGHLHGRR